MRSARTRVMDGGVSPYPEQTSCLSLAERSRLQVRLNHGTSFTLNAAFGESTFHPNSKSTSRITSFPLLSVFRGPVDRRSTYNLQTIIG